MANTIRANGIGHRTVVLWIIRDVLQYVLVLDCGIRCSKKRKSYTLKFKLEADEWVVLIEARSQIQAGSLIEAGGLTALF